ncbi:hypothetical protein HaLaN_25763, partial [Haematococcus lacustris]
MQPPALVSGVQALAPAVAINDDVGTLDNFRHSAGSDWFQCNQFQTASDSGVPNMGPRNLTISAGHWSLCPRTATCAREQITAARRVSLARAPRRGD